MLIRQLWCFSTTLYNTTSISYNHHSDIALFENIFSYLISTCSGAPSNSPIGVQELQLKGGGRTPFSRGFDGRAVLRSSVREFLVSEAMHHLRVPTTRALSLVGTGEMVRRPWYVIAYIADISNIAYIAYVD